MDDQTLCYLMQLCFQYSHRTANGKTLTEFEHMTYESASRCLTAELKTRALCLEATLTKYDEQT